MDREQIVDTIRDWLDEDDWHYEYDAEHHLIRMGVGLKSKLRSAHVIVDIKESAFYVYTIAPVRGDKENLTELMKYICMANYGLGNGNFELDIRDGEVRYKIFVNCEGLDELPKEIIRASILIGCLTTDRYGNGIAALALGFSSADDEIKKVEGDDDDDADEADDQ